MKKEKINYRLELSSDLEHFGSFCARINSKLRAAGVTPKELLGTLPEARKRVYERHYSKKQASKSTERFKEH